MRHGRSRCEKRREGGFTLIEVMVAVVVLTLAFYGLSQVYARGRRTLRADEGQRVAAAVAQARLEQLRRTVRYSRLPQLDGTDTTFTVDGVPYTVHHTVRAQTPEPQATTVSVQVTWPVNTASRRINRTLDVSTIIARSLPWSGS